MNEKKNKKVLIQYRMDQAHVALKEAVFLRENSESTLGAVNRAYYAMFYAVLALLQHIEKVPHKHTGAISLFDSEFVKKGIFDKKLSSFLHQTFVFRQESDYHTIEPVSPDKTDEIIKQASVFVQTVESYLKDTSDGLEV